jgi:hypothetical protein
MLTSRLSFDSNLDLMAISRLDSTVISQLDSMLISRPISRLDSTLIWQLNSTLISRLNFFAAHFARRRFAPRCSFRSPKFRATLLKSLTDSSLSSLDEQASIKPHFALVS